MRPCPVLPCAGGPGHLDRLSALQCIRRRTGRAREVPFCGQEGEVAVSLMPEAVGRIDRRGEADKALPSSAVRLPRRSGATFLRQGRKNA